MFRDIVFANPNFLYLLLVLPIIIAWYWFRHNKSIADIQVSTTKGIENIPKSFKQISYHSLIALRLLAITFIIIAFARPQFSNTTKNVSKVGIDILIAMDISGSMLAQDFKPNRLEASKKVAAKFISGRENDRIGLVLFAGETFLQCPLTSDHHVLQNLFESVKTGMIEDGTAIGSGLATAVNHLKDSKAISKVVILLTDGNNNRGAIDPGSAAEIAKLYGIRVYTIGVGTKGEAKMPVAIYPNGQYAYGMVKVNIDEDILTKVAKTTNGKYFRATNKKKLEGIYGEIDQLEKSKIEETLFEKKSEKFLLFLLIGASLLIFELMLRYLVFRTIP